MRKSLQAASVLILFPQIRNVCLVAVTVVVIVVVVIVVVFIKAFVLACQRKYEDRNAIQALFLLDRQNMINGQSWQLSV